MRITRSNDTGYQVACECGRTITARGGRMSFECPSCGHSERVADLVLELWHEQAMAHQHAYWDSFQ